MSETGKDRTMRAGDAVEVLLEQASPRPAPPPEDERIVREAVRAEWQAFAGRRVIRKRLTNFAVAATVLLAVFAMFNAFRVNDVAPVQVATIDKSHGSIYLLGEQSQLHELTDLAAISAGQTIVTGSAAGIGLAWREGGSLRIDGETRIEFIAENSVFLRSGRVYYDSQLAAAAAGTPRGVVLEINTEHGTVTNLGTQFMTFVDAAELSVTVREGRVALAGTYHDATAGAGQQVRVTGNAQPSVTNFPVYGEAWGWIEDIGPAPNLTDKSVHEYLRWVSRETGLRLEYDGAAAEQLAHAERFIGTVEGKPIESLDIWMMGIDLDYRVAGGVIYVSTIDSGSGR